MNCLILPCAGSLQIDMQAEFGQIPAAALPMGNSVALETILRPIYQHYDLIYVALAEEYPILTAICRRLSEKIHVINVGHTRSVGRTVHSVLEQLPQEVTSVTIQSGDSYHHDPVQHSDSIGYSRDQMVNRWVTFKLDEDGKIAAFQLPSPDPRFHTDFVYSGKFTVTRIAEFKALLQHHLEETSARVGAPGQVLFRALKAYFNNFTPVPLVESKGWQDLGYLASYYHFRRDSGFNARAFNWVKFDASRSSMLKRSENKQKLSEEIKWYQSLPANLQYAIPRIYAANTDEKDPWVEMEYIPAIPLDQIFMYSRCPNFVWHSIARQVKNFLQLCRANTSPAPSLATSKAIARTMYVEKTVKRIEQYEADLQFSGMRHSSPTINGKLCISLQAAKDTIREWAAADSFASSYVHSILHGDLCFSNLLYDMRLDMIRVIDPRGRFGEAGIHGDLRYDLGKLYQCSHGMYDLLVNEFFHLHEREKNNFELVPLLSPSQQTVAETFSAFIRSFAINEADLLFIEATLFLSMIPLHKDKPKAQKAFALRGLSSLTDALALRDSQGVVARVAR